MRNTNSLRWAGRGRMRTTNSLRWAGISGVLLALAVVLVVAMLTASQGFAQEKAKGKEADEPKQQTEASGKVGAARDDDGETEYNLSANGGTVELDAGPPWFYEDDYPLAQFVGETVTVTGESGTNREGEPEIDVLSVTTRDGQTERIRSEGKPPWAGGPKEVGSKHPGYGKADAED